MAQPMTLCVRNAAALLCLLTLSVAPAAAQQAAQQAGGDGGNRVTLNLEKADIRALIDTVSQTTGRNFIVDPRVQGEVTVISARPMTPEALYQTFLAVLEVNGYAAIEADNAIKIVPEADAKQQGGADAGRGPPADIITRVLEVTNMPAAQLVPILRPLVPQYGHLAAYPPANMLIISDRKGNVERLTRLVNRIDTARDDQVAVVELEHANASEITRIVNSMLQEQGNAAAGVKLVAEPRTNSVLISGPENRRLRVRELINQLDQPLQDQGNTQVTQLRYSDAEKMAEVLRNVAQGQAAQGSGGGSGSGSGGGSGAPNGEVSIVAHKPTNSLVLNAPPETMSSLQSVIRQLDMRRPQVLVEAIIAEISSDRAAELGVQWAVGERDEDTNTPAALSNFNSSGTSIVGAIQEPGATFRQASGLSFAAGVLNEDGFNFVSLLRALSGDASTNILSTPSLTTLDNQEAEIQVGQEVPFITGQFTGQASGGQGGQGATNPFQTVERKEVGIKLKITPKINKGNDVELAIEQEVSGIAETAQTATDLITNKRTLTTNVIVQNGQLLVLGGLMDDEVRENVQKIPILGDIPVLGVLFRSTTSDTVKRNLMSFIRPTILRDHDDTRRVTARKYQRMRNLQLRKGEKDVRLMPDEDRPVMPPLDLRKEAEGEGQEGGDRGETAPGGATGESP